ncbi:MAG: hypothetical protein Q9M10_04370 [Mariprofundaceae bacterium]|nr:hypothetical protein [Mariprofundaceae bacterium]
MSDFPSLSSLLIQGDDHRLKLDAHGRNSYGCQPKPKANLLSLGSSTASNISPQQWVYAQRLHASMQKDVQETCLEKVKQTHTQYILGKLRKTCQLPEQTDIQLVDSGTHAHHLAMQYFCRKKPHVAWHIIMVDALETGRGVPNALCLPDYNITCKTIAIRHTSGEPRSPDDIEQDFEQATQIAIQKGLEVVLLMVDVSKTGYIAPSLHTMLKLRHKQPQSIHLLLDACQFRFSIETLNNYLHHDMVVIITGSKFLAAPSFCAAVLIPHQTQQRQEPQPLGVLLRWHLALHHLQALNRLQSDACATWMQTLVFQIQTRLQHDKHLTYLSTPPIQRPEQTHISKQAHWQHLPTIFPFLITIDKKNISHKQALRIFQSLQWDKEKPIQLGRPMPLMNKSEGEPSGVFRLCISAPMVIHAFEKETYTHDSLEHVVYALQQLKELAKKEALE